MMNQNKPRSPRVAALLARIAKYQRPLSAEDAAEVRREMVEFLLGCPAPKETGKRQATLH
jgi:hypothetical protein